MKSDKYDIIIIGAGIGGLVSGCFLAKAGKKVLIIEQHDKPGGCVAAIKRKGCIFDMGAHLFGSCNDDGILGQCLEKIGVKIDFLRLNPSDRFFFPDETIEVPNDIEAYREMLKNKFPNQSKQLGLFFEEIIWIAKNFTRPYVLKEYINMTYQCFLDYHFDDNKLKGILSAQYLYIGARPNCASLIFMAVLLVSYLKDGIYYPRGGTQILPDAITKRFNEHGGEAVFNSRVSKILFDANHQANGVEIINGTKIYADIIIVNTDVEKVFLDLIRHEATQGAYGKSFAKYKKSTSLFLLFFALKNYDISEYRGWHFESYDMNNKFPILYLFTPTLLDKSLAPDGINIGEVLVESPYEYNKVSDWGKCKKYMQEKMMQKLEHVTNNKLKEHLYFIDSATPHTFEKFTLNSNGAVYGWEMSPDQIGSKRMPAITPFDNIYLVGHWTLPGCGVPSVAVSGWALAKKILEKPSTKTIAQLKV